MDTKNQFIKLLKKVFIESLTIKYWAAIGLVLVISGNSLMREFQESEFLYWFTEPSQKLNTFFYLTLKNPSNVLIGLFLITLAILIYWFSFKSLNSVKDTLSLPDPIKDWGSIKKYILWGGITLGTYIWVMLQLALHKYENAFVWVWLICILTFTFLFWKSSLKSTINNLLSYIDIIWILILFSLAIFISTYLLKDLPAGWIADEGPFWKVARSIALKEEHPAFFDFGVFTFPVSSSILQGWIMKWVGINFWGWRFSSVLPAVLTIFPLYILSHQLFNRQVAITTCIMMVTNPYFLAFARLGYNNSQSLLPVTLCICLFVIGLKRNSSFYLWLAGLVSGLGFYTYFAAWLGIVVLITLILILSWIYNIKFRIAFFSMLIVLSGMLIVSLPRILYGMSGDESVNLHYKIWETGPINTFYGNFVFGEEIIARTNVFKIGTVEVFYDLSLYGILFVRGIIRTFAVLFDPIGYNDHLIYFGLAGPGASLFFIIGLGVIIANTKKLGNLVSLIWFLAGFFCLGLLASVPPRPTHMVAITPVLSLIASIGLISLINILIDEANLKIISKIICGVILFIIALMGLFHYFFMIPYIYSPPNEDDYISWLGRQTSIPINFLLIGHDAMTRNPEDETLSKMTNHKVVSLSIEDLREILHKKDGNWENFVIFISINNGNNKEAQQINNQIANSKLYEAYSTGKRLRGYVITDLAINTAIDISFSRGIKSVWDSPARIIILTCLTAIIIIFLVKIPIVRKKV